MIASAPLVLTPRRVRFCFWDEKTFEILVGEWRGLPVLAANRIANQDVPQYFYGYDEELSNQNMLVVDIAQTSVTTRNDGVIVRQTITASVQLRDGGENALPDGTTLSRVLWQASTEDAAEAEALFSQALAAVIEHDDLRPERVRYEERIAARDALLAGYPDRPSRAEYEAACARLNMEPASAEEARRFFLAYSHQAGGYLCLSPDRMACIDVEFRYGRTIPDAPPPPPRPAPVPRKTGQLWEPCERCGAEPCYMPLHLCDRCWPSQG